VRKAPDIYMEDSQGKSPLPQERVIDSEIPPRRVEPTINPCATDPSRGGVGRAKLSEFAGRLPETEPVSPCDLDLSSGAKVERSIRRLADSGIGWSSQDIDAINMCCHDPSAESLPGSSDVAATAADDGSGLQWREASADDPVDEALSRDPDPDECVRLERHICAQLRAKASRRREETGSIDAMWGDDAPAGIMGRIGSHFAQAGDCLRLGILSQKRSC